MPTSERPKFGVVVTSVMRDSSLSMNARALYALLCTYADQSGKCWPSNETLAKDLGVSSATLERAMYELRDHGVIVREDRFIEGRRTTSATHLVDVVVNVMTDRILISEDDVLLTTEDPVLLTGEEENKNTKNNPTRNTSSSPAATTGFDSWWSLYPRKVGKAAASRAYDRAITKDGITPDLLHASLKSVAGLLGKDLRFCPHPSTWLNEERWNDVPARQQHTKSTTEPNLWGLR